MLRDYTKNRVYWEKKIDKLSVDLLTNILLEFKVLQRGLMFENKKLVDLTHRVDSSIPTWSGSCGFKYDIKRDYGEGVRVLKYEIHGSCGTHMDAPTHFIKDGKNIADIQLEHLFTPCAVLDLSKKCSKDLWITYDDIKDYESEYGKLQKGTFVIGYTGWQEFWKDPTQYRNVQEGGGMAFPGFSIDAAEALLERGIVGIGIDTLSPDGSDMEKFPVHHAVLGSGKFIVENMCNLHHLPKKGAHIVTLPLKLKEGTESAVRSVAIIQKG